MRKGQWRRGRHVNEKGAGRPAWRRPVNEEGAVALEEACE